MKRVLFICKKNQGYGSYSSNKKSSGLFNSTKFVADIIGAKVVIVNDNNDIDREVSLYRPDKVVIEAIWVVPDKFDTLKRLHPDVKWAVHIHSNIPFLANEGVAIQWLEGYVQRGVEILINCKKAYSALKKIHKKHIRYLPNYYPPKFKANWRCSFLDWQPRVFIDIGCFGAIRPMKNQLNQAIAAIEFAKSKKLWLNFHINSSRVETHGENVLKNLRALFENEKTAVLVEHKWADHEEFLTLLRKMDLGLQVSMSETFNIVTADMVTSGVPVVVSSEIPWISRFSVAQTSSVDDMVHKMQRAYCFKSLVTLNQVLLWFYSKEAKVLWRHWARIS